MRIKLVSLVLASALIGLGLGVTVATAGDGPRQQPGVAAPAPEGVVPAIVAPNARAAAWVDYTGVPLRQEGFLKVKHIQAGDYCLKLKSTIAEDTLVAFVSPEFSHSNSFNVAAHWYAPHPNCPILGNWVEVLTYDDTQSGSWSFADQSFSIVIP